MPRELVGVHAVSLWHGGHDGDPGRGARPSGRDWGTRRRSPSSWRAIIATCCGSPTSSAETRPWRRTRPRRRGRSRGAGWATSRTRPRSAAGSSPSPRTRPAEPCGRAGRLIHEISVADIELEGVPDLRADPLAAGIANADLRRVLASLDPTDRALIALRYVAELSSDEIGRALGMSSSGARGRLSRLLLRLRGELDDG